MAFLKAGGLCIALRLAFSTMGVGKEKTCTIPYYLYHLNALVSS